MHKAVFLDRDNTIIKDEGFFHDAEQIVFMPGAIEGLHALQTAGYLLIVITNQSGIGRGYFPESDVVAVHKKMIELLEHEGVRIEKIYYCPHAPEENCECRKPKPFLILQAAKEFDIDLAQSFFIGDRMNDMEAGRAAGTKTVFITHGQTSAPSSLIDFTADTLDASLYKKLGI